MKYMFPDYDNGLINVICSIENYFGIKPSHKTLPKLDEIIKENNNKNIVLFLFDGLGYNIVCNNKNICPFLYEHLSGSISSNFPSTTMSSRTTIESGLLPIEHGWLGWDMYFKDFNQVITLTKNEIKGTKEKAANFHVAKTYLKYKSVSDKINDLNDCIGKTYRVYSNNPISSLRKLNKNIKKLTKEDKKVYIYAYYNEPDHVLHHNGVGSNKMKKYLRYINKWLKKICKCLKDTTVIAIADHGHINVEYINLIDYPNIINMLKGKISIDDRATSFRVKNEYKKEFYYEIKKVLKDDFIIMTKEEVIKNKLYGIGTKNKYFDDALGDYFAIAIGRKAIRYDSNTNKHISAHSGLTLDEMLVPLIVIDTNKM